MKIYAKKGKIIDCEMKTNPKEKIDIISKKLNTAYAEFDRETIFPNKMNVPFVEAKADLFRAIKKIEKIKEGLKNEADG